MCGDLNPTEGAIRRHIHLEMGRFHQHSVDILTPSKTVLQFFMDSFPEKKWRSNLGASTSESMGCQDQHN